MSELRSQSNPRVLYITSSLPSLTLTFIYREINALEKLGIKIDIATMNRPAIENVSFEARPFLDRVLFLDQVNSWRYLPALVAVFLKRPVRLLNAVILLLQTRPRSTVRDFARLVYHLVQATYLSRRLPMIDYVQIHAHFVSGPSSIAMYMSELTDIPFSFTMHGSQIYVDPIGLATKLEKCRFAVSISDFHRQYVLDKYGRDYENKLHIVRCGIETSRFPPLVRDATKAGVFRILGVGRLVEVKGFEYLLRACAELTKKKMEYICHIVGDGELRDSLGQMAIELGIEDKVIFEGAKGQLELEDFYSSADVFCLPCVVARDGACDGLPVVLMEAMVWQLPVISSRLVGIPELVENHKHGILVAPKDIHGLADAITFVYEHSERAAAWGQSGRAKVIESFDVSVSAREMKRLFDE